MAHREQEAFVRSVREAVPFFFRKTRVLEVGSRYVNGSVRVFFQECDYTGIDCTPGRCVDVVTLAHSFDVPAIPFDVVISCETFEHDPFIEGTLSMIAKALRPGGLFVATMAGMGRAEHGTLASDGAVYGPEPTYYRSISEQQLREWMDDLCAPSIVQPSQARNHEGLPEDLYAWGYRRRKSQ